MNKRLIIFFVGVVILIGGVVLFSNGEEKKTTNAHISSGIWHEKMLAGDKNAPNKLVEYSDYFCSHCADFHAAISDSEFKKKYLDTKILSFETRIVTVLSASSPNTERGAHTAFCAADQGKFAEYSHEIVAKIKQNYFDKGVGVKFFNGEMLAQPKKIALLPVEFFADIAAKVGLDKKQFASCVEQEKFASEIKKNTEKALSLGVTGLPFIVANDYIANGFDGGFAGLEKILQAGKADKIPEKK